MAVFQIEPDTQHRSPSMSLRALLYRRPSEPSTLQVVFDRSIYLVRLRRHRQARRYTLRIDASSREVVLTMPPRGSVKEAREFAQKHGGWIAARLKRLPEAAPFAHGTDVPLRGISHRIVHRRGERGTVWTETSHCGERLLCVAGEPAHVNRRINDFLKREAARDLAPASSASSSNASRCATKRAGGARARIPVCCPSPGGSFWRRPSCSSISLRTRCATSWSSITPRAFGAWSSVTTPISSAPRPGSTCMAPICTVTGCRQPRL